MKCFPHPKLYMNDWIVEPVLSEVTNKNNKWKFGSHHTAQFQRDAICTVLSIINEKYNYTVLYIKDKTTYCGTHVSIVKSCPSIGF